MYFIGPLAVVLIFMILFALYGNFKFPVAIAVGVLMTEPVGALVALKLTHTPFSVSSAWVLWRCLGFPWRRPSFLSLTSTMLRQEGNGHSRGHTGSFAAPPPSDHDDGSGRLSWIVTRSLSTGIGSDTQRPFAIVIVAGSSPDSSSGSSSILCCYEMVAREGDVLQV